MPSTHEEAVTTDRMIIPMKDVVDKNWPEIRKAVADTTGADTGNSTIRVRYTRMKEKFVIFEAEHVCITWFAFVGAYIIQRRYELTIVYVGALFFFFWQIKKEIEDKFENEKWKQIANGIEARVGNKYPSSAIQKKFKEVSMNGNGNGVICQRGQR